MPPLEAFGPSLAIGLILFVMLWFAIGTQRNVRLGNDILRWLQSGLPLIGPRTTLQWLGSSAVQLRIADAKPPFRDAEVIVVLEPRDVAVLWWYARARGRRDFVIVRANLIRAPRFSADVRDPAGWTSRDDPPAFEPPDDNQGAKPLDWPDGRATIGPGADEAAMRIAWAGLRGASTAVWRLTVQPVVPHLEVQLRLGPRDSTTADQALRPIRELAEAITRG